MKKVRLLPRPNGRSTKQKKYGCQRAKNTSSPALKVLRSRRVKQRTTQKKRHDTITRAENLRIRVVLFGAASVHS